jgi:hypothetical protein
MPRKTLSACPLPGGGARYLAPPWKGYPGLLIVSGLFLWVVGPIAVIDLFFNPRNASSPKGWLVVLPVFALVWFLVLFAWLFCRRGILLADGRIGVAWWFGRRSIRWRYRNLADIRRLVVLRNGDSLVVGCEEARPLVLARRYPGETLLPVARDLAARCQALTGVDVPVHEEELPFTRDRVNQPIFSRVKAQVDGPATTFTFPSVSWRASRTESRPWQLVVDGRGYLARCVAGLAVVLFAVLLVVGAGYTAVNHARGRPSALIVRAGTVTLPAPPPNPSFAVRLREAVMDFGRTLACILLLLAFGVWLIRRALMEASRCRDETVTRRRRVLCCSRPVALTARPGELSLRVPCAEQMAFWPQAEVDSVEAFYTVHETPSEGGTPTITIATGLRILTFGGEEWVLQGGTTHADWAWVATRTRAILGLEGFTGQVEHAEKVTAAGPGQTGISAAGPRMEHGLVQPPSGVMRSPTGTA